MPWMDLLPPDLPVGIAAALIVFSFFMSALTAVLGVGGGTGMLAVMAGVFPPAVLIPIHGIVQLGSNGGRAIIMRRHVHRPILAWFLAGGLVGTVLAANVFVVLPTRVLQIGLALFIVFLVWAPKLRAFSVSVPGFLGVGLVVNFVGMFVGAVGPLVGACLSAERLDRHTIVATQGACVSLHYLLKAIAFGVIGFAYSEWLFFIAAMIGSGFIGTVYGGKLLDRLPERSFALAFRIVLTLFAAKLLWDGLSG